MPTAPAPTRSRQPERIVSLLASGTELVCALGAGDRLVGRSHECDYPEWVKALPAVSHPTFEVTGSSQQIDEQVRERLRSGQALYEVDKTLLAGLAPDFLITQTHCEVCAVSPADVAAATDVTRERKVIVSLRGGTLDGVLEGFRDVATLLGLREAGERLVAGCQGRIAGVREKVQLLERRTVVCLEWMDPVFAAGNWGPELVAHAGGRDVLGRLGEHSTTTPWQDVRRADPEVLIVAPCGFPIDRTLQEMHVLAANAGWHQLRSVRDGRVFVADGNLYFNRSGPSLFETVEILAEILHPQEFPPRHEGTAWRSYRPERTICATPPDTR